MTVFVLIFVVSASAIDLGFLFPGPKITDVQVTPLKVRPGIPLEICIETESSAGIDSAFASFNFENGSDRIRMTRTASSGDNEEFSAVWLTHDTLDKKWYTTDLEITDKSGRTVLRTVDWQDPVVSHNWSELTGTGYCILSFNHTTCPDGYTSLGSSGRFLRANSTSVGTTGGSNTHFHTVNGTTSAPSTYPYGKQRGTRGYSTGSDRLHTHNVNTVTDNASNRVWHYKLTVCCRI